MTIGAVARDAGVSVETIRFYQRRGLIDEPVKPFGRVRQYPADVTARVRFIKSAQALGFTLEEIATLLRPESMRACAATRDLARGKIAMIERKLAELVHMRDALEALIAQCEPDRPEAGCAIIRCLAQDEMRK